MARTSLLPKMTRHGSGLPISSSAGGSGNPCSMSAVSCGVTQGGFPGLAGAEPIPDGAGREADDRADPERRAPSVMQNDMGHQWRGDAGAHAHAGEDDTVRQTALPGRNPVGD